MAYWTFLALFVLQCVLVSSYVSGQKTTSGGDCVFPFTYKGKVYRSCTTKNHKRPWCSTTRDYDVEKKWGDCAGYKPSGVKTIRRQTCAFPFIYNRVKYYSCTTAGRHHRAWCSTTVNYDLDEMWGDCKDFKPSGVKTDAGEYCVFPFKFDGRSYRSCTTIGFSRPWCSTTANYNYDYKWGPCKGFYSGAKTTSGQYCAFPFVYKGVVYNTCINKNHNRPWCSTTTNYDKDKKWGDCA